MTEVYSNNPSTSPVPKNVEDAQIAMSFQEAIAIIMSGGKITRVEWNDEKEYFFMEGDDLMVHHINGSITKLLLRRPDMEATDWIVIR